MLKINNLTAHYGAAQALFGVDLEIGKGETVALVGANGAGKSTLLKCLMGLIKPSGGQISLNGKDVTNTNPAQMVRLGLALSPEGREVFGHLSVLENLQLGAIPLKLSKAEATKRMEEVFSRFPKLQERREQLAGSLSGGEQQMLAMGRALMAKPSLLLLDEPSLGLAPLITDEIFAIIHQLARSGTTILLVEQNAARALSASDKAYLLANGKIIEQGKSSKLLNDPILRSAFLGAASDTNPAASRLGAAGLTNIRLEKPDMQQQNFMPGFKTAEELQVHQLAGLQWTIRHVYEGSTEYREKLDQANITPDTIQSLDDLQKLPFTTAVDLRDGYPFPLRSVPFEQIVRVHASSGTTGKRKVLCYTQKDLETVFAEHLQGADMDKIKRWYNGYNYFAEAIYNPFDILQFIAKKNVFENYWWETGNPSFLIEMLKKSTFYMPDLENLVVGKETLNAFDVDRIELVALLWQTGYLTFDKEIVTNEQRAYKMKVPNIEVQKSLNTLFFDYLTSNLFGKKSKELEIADILVNGKLEDFELQLKSLFAAIPYNNHTKNVMANYEGYYSSVIYSFLAGLGFDIKGEDVSIKGRIDLTVKTENTIYILEYKVDSTEEPIKQIKERKYYEKYRAENKAIYIIGIKFDYRERNIAEFKWARL
ncbi:MAG: ATP-binding cassette domain-containing protein [Desulfuromusa sp.]|nr:ATP-binding cassette domain-containing protein [Desulfuromusa sp.]